MKGPTSDPLSITSRVARGGRASSGAPPSSRAVSRWLVLGLAAYSAIGGLVSFLGWALDAPALTDWQASGISIQPNTAVASALMGAALLLLERGRARAAGIPAAIAAAIGAATLVEHLLDVDLGIDRVLLFDRAWGTTSVVAVGRMGPTAATSWTLLGVGVVLAGSVRSSRARAVATVLASIALLLSALNLVGYLYSAKGLYTIPSLSAIALQTATFVCASSVALLVAIPEHGPMRVLVQDSPGGVLARRLAPAMVLGPVLIGFLRLLGERAGWYDPAFGSALRTVCEIVVFTGVLWWTASVVHRNAVERVDSDRVVRESREHVVATLESLSDAFVTFDASWRYVFVNREAERLLGMRREDLLGRTPWELFGDSSRSEVRAALHRAAHERTSVVFEHFDRASSRWFANRAYPAPEGGVAVAFEDVTERKLADLQLEESRARIQRDLGDSRLLQRISTELVASGGSPRFYANLLEAAVQLLSADSATIQSLRATPDEPVLELLAHRGLDDETAELWKRVRLDSPSVCARTLASGARTIVADAQALDYLKGTPSLDAYRRLGVRTVQSTPLVSRSGRTVGVLSTQWRAITELGERELRLLDILARQAADLMERRELEQQRELSLEQERAARGEAERAGRLKDEFLATLSHELRTPLNAIIGWAQILRKDAREPERVVAAAEVIERNGRLQAQLVTDLLDVSRIVAGGMRLELAPIELPTVIDAAIDSMLPTANAKGVRLEVLADAPSAPVLGDAARLQQIVWNLLSNAVKFTPRGGRVQVVLLEVAGRAQVSVIDTGEGIAPEFLPHVFERFRQADASATRVHGGLGLGLAIVKQLVELHGGSVRASSEGKGHGATFRVELPLTPRRASGGASDRADPPHVEYAVDLRGVRVLLVDDDRDGLAATQRAFEGRGAQVFAAERAERALEVLATTPIDAIVSDIGMPGRDGHQMMSEARRRGVRAPAVALTAFARAEDRAHALAAGFQAHVAKPADAELLLATVASVLRAHVPRSSGASTPTAPAAPSSSTASGDAVAPR